MLVSDKAGKLSLEAEHCKSIGLFHKEKRVELDTSFFDRILAFQQLVSVGQRQKAEALMPCSQDTVTGFLLAGVGNVDLRKKSNYLVVNESEPLIQLGNR